MAKTDNLTDFLTDLADTIRTKKGTTDKINPQNFASEIEGIETGITEVSTADEMTALLTNATADSVGNVYKYTGETTDTYENRALYILEETPVIGDITITAKGAPHEYTAVDASGNTIASGDINAGSSVHITDLESGSYINLINGNMIHFTDVVNCTVEDGSNGRITNIGVGASVTANYSDV